MSQARSQRIFSEKRHKEGGWKTRVSETRNPLVRAAWDFLSFKRHGIDTLARRSGKNIVALDAGSGNGAYSQWFLGRRAATIVALDWSYDALTRISVARHGRIFRVCADIRAMPFSSEKFDCFFSIDTLGHVPHTEQALDEMLRVARPGAPFFIHSECDDHRKRWPDSALIRTLGHDALAELDGHWGLRSAADVYTLIHSRFRVNTFFSPAGILGWIIGYPEKYRIAFRRASWPFLSFVTSVFGVAKRTPGLGVLIRLVNAVGNRLELFFGIVGGGSCFAHGSKLPLMGESAADR